MNWVEGSFYEPKFEEYPPRVRGSALQSLQLALRLEQLPEGASDKGRLDGLISSMGRNDEFALDVIDWMLHCPGHFAWRKRETKSWTEKLGAILREGGSPWEVTPNGETFRLTRRAVGPVADVLENTALSAPRAHAHLSDAWAKLMGRDQDASGAYREAVRAVEAVAKPVVLPNSDRATLGQVIAAMREKPEKWLTTWGPSPMSASSGSRLDWATRSPRD
jgi:hypothetical protein